MALHQPLHRYRTRSSQSNDWPRLDQESPSHLYGDSHTNDWGNGLAGSAIDLQTPQPWLVHWVNSLLFSSYSYVDDRLHTPYQERSVHRRCGVSYRYGSSSVSRMRHAVVGWRAAAARDERVDTYV